MPPSKLSLLGLLEAHSNYRLRHPLQGYRLFLYPIFQIKLIIHDLQLAIVLIRTCLKEILHLHLTETLSHVDLLYLNFNKNIKQL